MNDHGSLSDSTWDFKVSLGLDSQIPEKEHLWRYLGEILRELALQEGMHQMKIF
jgi:hypothetical protein